MSRPTSRPEDFETWRRELVREQTEQLGRLAEIGLNMAAHMEGDREIHDMTMRSVRLTMALQAYIAHGSVAAALAASRRSRADGVMAHLLPTEEDFRQLQAEFEADMRDDFEDEFDERDL